MQHNELEVTEEDVKSTKESSAVSVIAFLAGLAVGFFVKTPESKPTSSPLMSEVPTVDLSQDDGVVTFENITPDSSTLLDSLEGIAVDGTNADLVKVRVLGVERAKLVAMWGSKGVNGDESTKFQRMADLTTEHLLNIKKNSPKVTPDERRIIDSILEDRVASGEADADVLAEV